MYFCDPEYFDEEDEPYKHFNICEGYPNVLLKNDQPIPIYSIYDNIKDFKDIHNLEKTGEFYIDEYGCDLKIEAGFYSSNLAKDLVHVLKMDSSDI